MTMHRPERTHSAHCGLPLALAPLLSSVLVLALALVACGKEGAAPASPAQAPAAPATASTASTPAAETVLHARFVCESGSFRVLLATKEAPTLCANFINLVGRGYYEGQAWGDFSRVVRQTGRNPGKDPVYTMPREFSRKLFFDAPGRLCASNDTDNPSSARAMATRIFVTVRPQERWNLQYSVFGTIVEGLDVATALQEGEKIVRIEIEGDASAHLAAHAARIAEWNAALDAAGIPARR
jgi:peptidyl-prolyl cis-trans isomerase B (cyclophilin B)